MWCVAIYYAVIYQCSTSVVKCVLCMITRRMQCVVRFLYAVYTTVVFGVVEQVNNYAR